MKAIPVIIQQDGWVFNPETTVKKPNGLAFTNEQLADHDKRVAQEAWEASKKHKVIMPDYEKSYKEYEFNNFLKYWAEQQARKGQ